MNFNETETKTVKQLVIILVVVIIVAILAYFITTKVVNKTSSSDDSSSTSSNVNYIDPTKAIVGTMLNRTSDDYYVILYSTDSDNSSAYARLLSQYSNKDGALPAYLVDLNNKLNESYVASADEKTNPTASELKDLRFGEITLLHIKNHKIVKAFESVEAIKKEWKLTD